MIDDFVPVAVTTDGKINPSNDWGFLYDNENSLYRYLDITLFNEFPEIRGTFFIPLKSQNYINDKDGYVIFRKDFDEGFREFTGRIKERFDFAFHGIAHTYTDQTPEGEKLKYEFQHLTPADIPRIKKEIEEFQRISGLAFTGGKYPGNRANEYGERIVEELEFLWWTQRKLFNIKDPRELVFNKLGRKKNIIDIPQTFLGDAFNKSHKNTSGIKSFIRPVRDNFRFQRNEKHLKYLIENRIPITIQEHFQNATTRGNRQRPNIYDDVTSIAKIYSKLRGANVWHAKCTELVQYHDCYINSTITVEGNRITIKYKGPWSKYLLTILTDNSVLIHSESEKLIRGIHQNGRWIHNLNKDGTYILNGV